MPSSADFFMAPETVQNLTGTGSQAVGSALQVGTYATAVFDTAVRLAFGSTAPTATTSSAYWPANVPFHWYVKTATQFIAAIHDDGASAIDGSVWRSGPQ